MVAHIYQLHFTARKRSACSPAASGITVPSVGRARTLGRKILPIVLFILLAIAGLRIAVPALAADGGVGYASQSTVNLTAEQRANTQSEAAIDRKTQQILANLGVGPRP
jgi:hypothetical protein